MNSIAVLMTCFNRKKTTIRCLEHLYKLKSNLDVYLVDDNSTDGTSKEIQNKFPQVNLIKGSGNLFWSRGMNKAWEQASKYDYDYYLWLNDDVILYDNCFSELFENCEFNNNNNNAIISGVIETKDKSNIIYGGFDKNKNIITPNGKMKEITYMNGNVVLVPKFVFNVLHFLDPIFHHDLGDVDYGLRATKNNIKVYSTKVPIGSGETNNICRVRLNGTTIKRRFLKLYSPIGSNPNITFYFNKNHYGYLKASLFYLFIILINILPDVIVHKLFKNRYR